MALHLPTFLTRLGSAIVFAIIMMAGLLWNQWAFVVLALLIHDLCLQEYIKLTGLIYPDTAFPVWLQYLLRSLGNILVLTILPVTALHDYYPVLLAIPTLILILTLLSSRNLLPAALQSMGGLLYITLPVLLLLQLRGISIVIPIGLILMIWTNDTMAYLVGSFIGKTPFSTISPKKTWEGTAGGAILTIAGAAVWGYYAPYYRMIDWMALALCAAVAGTAGDLLESKLKRMAGVKDSGAIMPGHGGALDRFDSLLVATPFAFAYAWCFMPALDLTIL